MHRFSNKRSSTTFAGKTQLLTLMTTKRKLMVLISLWALWTTALAETNWGFDGTWLGGEYIYKTIGTWPQQGGGVPISHPTFIIANNGTVVGRLNGPGAGRFDHVVLKGGTLCFAAGNTSFELRLSNNGKTLNETMHVVAKPHGAECWITGHYHRQ
jgi:hypothetical protein